MWVARSRSPSPNQSGCAPYAASSALAVNVSSDRPQPALLVRAAAEGVHDGVEVRADPQAEQRDVVGGVHHRDQVRRPAAAAGVAGSRVEHGPDAAEEARAADPPASTVTSTRVILAGGLRAADLGGLPVARTHREPHTTRRRARE